MRETMQLPDAVLRERERLLHACAAHLTSFGARNLRVRGLAGYPDPLHIPVWNAPMVPDLMAEGPEHTALVGVVVGEKGRKGTEGINNIPSVPNGTAEWHRMARSVWTPCREAESRSRPAPIRGSRAGSATRALLYRKIGHQGCDLPSSDPSPQALTALVEAPPPALGVPRKKAARRPLPPPCKVVRGSVPARPPPCPGEQESPQPE